MWREHRSVRARPKMMDLHAMSIGERAILHWKYLQLYRAFHTWRIAASIKHERRDTAYDALGLAQHTTGWKKTRRGRAPTLNIVAGHIYRVRATHRILGLFVSVYRLCGSSWPVWFWQDGKRHWSVPQLMELAEEETEALMQRREVERIEAMEEAAARQSAMDEQRKQVRRHIRLALVRWPSSGGCNDGRVASTRSFGVPAVGAGCAAYPFWRLRGAEGSSGDRPGACPTAPRAACDRPVIQEDGERVRTASEPAAGWHRATRTDPVPCPAGSLARMRALASPLRLCACRLRRRCWPSDTPLCLSRVPPP